MSEWDNNFLFNFIFSLFLIVIFAEPVYKGTRKYISRSLKRGSMHANRRLSFIWTLLFIITELTRSPVSRVEVTRSLSQFNDIYFNRRFESRRFTNTHATITDSVYSEDWIHFSYSIPLDRQESHEATWEPSEFIVWSSENVCRAKLCMQIISRLELNMIETRCFSRIIAQNNRVHRGPTDLSVLFSFCANEEIISIIYLLALASLHRRQFQIQNFAKQ